MPVERVSVSRSEYTTRMDETGLLNRRAQVMGPAYRLFYEEPLHLVCVFNRDACSCRAATTRG